jgi:hypothetical protein
MLFSNSLNLSHPKIIDKSMLLSAMLDAYHSQTVDKPIGLSATLKPSHSLVSGKTILFTATMNQSSVSLIDKPVNISNTLNVASSKLIDKLMLLSNVLDLTHSPAIDKPVSMSQSLQTVTSSLIDKLINLSGTLDISHIDLIDKLMLLSSILDLTYLNLIDKPILLSASLNVSHGRAIDKPVIMSAVLNPSYLLLNDKLMNVSAVLRPSHLLSADKSIIILDSLHFSDIAYKIFIGIEILSEGWKFYLEQTIPPSTPISGSSPGSQVPYALILSSSYGWFTMETLIPILDVELMEGGVLEQSIIADIPNGGETGLPQYLGSEDDLVLLRLRGPVDMIRQLDYLNRNDEVSVRVRCNGATWWQGYVRFLNFAGQPLVSSEENHVTVDIPAKGKAEVVSRTMLGMFGDCPNEAKYMVLLTSGHGWIWAKTLVETGEEI